MDVWNKFKAGVVDPILGWGKKSPRNTMILVVGIALALIFVFTPAKGAEAGVHRPSPIAEAGVWHKEKTAPDGAGGMMGTKFYPIDPMTCLDEDVFLGTYVGSEELIFLAHERGVFHDEDVYPQGVVDILVWGNVEQDYIEMWTFNPDDRSQVCLRGVFQVYGVES